MSEIESGLRDVFDQIKSIDAAQGTDLTTYVRHCVQTMPGGLSKQEFQELLGDNLKLCELDSILKDERTIQLVQTLFNQVVGFVTSSLFK